jgi:hypothetical protein
LEGEKATDTKGQMPRQSTEKPAEIVGDPDAEMYLQESIREQLLRHQQTIQAGERDQPLEGALQQLGLE